MLPIQLWSSHRVCYKNNLLFKAIRYRYRRNGREGVLCSSGWSRSISLFQESLLKGDRRDKIRVFVLSKISHMEPSLSTYSLASPWKEAKELKGNFFPIGFFEGATTSGETCAWWFSPLRRCCWLLLPAWPWEEGLILVSGKGCLIESLGSGKAYWWISFWILVVWWIWVFPKIGVGPSNHPFVHRVFHYFHHPFWGVKHPYIWKHPYVETYR